jgi:hypothetical protein
MPTIRQLSFSGGEIAPALYARVDQNKYATGLKLCKNFIVMRHGGLINRAGTYFIGETKDSTKQTRLFPFIFNPNQTYVLEFGHLYIRFHRLGSQVLMPSKNILDIAKANPIYINVPMHEYLNGDEIRISGVKGMTNLNNRNFKVQGKTPNTFSLLYADVNYNSPVNASSFNKYEGGGTVSKIYEIISPYTESDLMDLQITQSADIVTIVHPNYKTRELRRNGHTDWSLYVIEFKPIIDAPTNLVVTKGGAGANTYTYKVTAIDNSTLEESLPSNAGTITLAAAPTSANPHTMTWTAVTNALQYEIYRNSDGIYGWIGTAGSNSFSDTNYAVDVADNPPFDKELFITENDYPSAITYYQQRLLLAGTNNNPNAINASRSNSPKNFTISSPSQDDDPITFPILGKQVHIIKHLLDLGKLLVFTSSGEFVVQGDSAGLLTPSTVNPLAHTLNGSGNLSPLIVDGSAIYIQASGSVVRDLGFDWQTQGYKGNELSIFASHLFEGHSIVDWAYQQIPHSIIWAVRDDGKLLGLTYVREHQVFGWHQHETDGIIKNVCVVPEGLEHVLYMIVRRIINGRTVRYIEYLKSRYITDIKDAVFVDSALTYDGRNTSLATMSLASSGTWTYDDSLTLNASSGVFTIEDVNNSIQFTDSDNEMIRCEIKSYVDNDTVIVKPNKTVPESLRNTNTTNWAKAIKTAKGLWHLEGKSLSAIGDGYIIANPNNEAYETITVASGTITFDEPYAVIHAGLPYISDMETLNIDNIDGESLADLDKCVGKVNLFVELTSGLWAGNDSSSLTEFKIREILKYDNPLTRKTDIVNINIKQEWNSNGRVLIRQLDPLPASILAIVVSGYIPTLIKR